MNTFSRNYIHFFMSNSTPYFSIKVISKVTIKSFTQLNYNRVIQYNLKVEELNNISNEILFDYF